MAQLKQRWWRWLLLGALLALVFYEIAWLTFLTPGEADLAHYACYGLTFWLGSHGTSLLPATYCAFLQPVTSQSPLHMLPLEYPPLTVLFFSLPLLAPLPYYALVFALLMTLSAGLISWLLARAEGRQAGLIFLLYLLLGTAGVFQERFDLLPAACTLLCLLAADRGRWRTAYLALALGVLLKLYPIVLLPSLFLAEQRAWLNRAEASTEHASILARRREQGPQETILHKEKKGAESGSADSPERKRASTWLAWTRSTLASWNWRNFLLCVGVILVVMGGFALLNFQTAILSPLAYFLNRPPQIESLSASLIWLGGHLGAPYEISFIFGSLNISSSLVRLISPVNTLLTLAGLLIIYWLHWRKRIDLAQAFTGLICVLIVTGKVFSPQYLLWLIPLLACLAARRQTNRLWLCAWAAISLLTTFIYVVYYSQMPDPQTAVQVVQRLPGFFELVALRNLLLLVTVLAYICGWWGTRTSVRVPHQPQM